MINPLMVIMGSSLRGAIDARITRDMWAKIGSDELDFPNDFIVESIFSFLINYNEKPLCAPPPPKRLPRRPLAVARAPRLASRPAPGPLPRSYALPPTAVCACYDRPHGAAQHHHPAGAAEGPHLQGRRVQPHDVDVPDARPSQPAGSLKRALSAAPRRATTASTGRSLRSRPPSRLRPKPRTRGA